MTANATAKRAKKVTFNATTSLSAINNNIALIRKNSNAFRELLQNTLVLIATHAKETGDCSAMARLMNDGLTNWYRRGPICDYVRDFTPILVTFKAGVAQVKFEEKDQRKPFNIEGMRATPFWDHKSLNRDNELPLDADAIDTNVTKLADKLQKKLVDGGVDPAAVEHAKLLIAGLRETVQKVRAADRAASGKKPAGKKPAGKKPKAAVEDAAAAMAAAAA